jgi:transcriptional adapter 3
LQFDNTTREDDEVTSALRQCQRLLSKQTVINEARKARIAEIACQRLAFSEYTSVLYDLEKQIEAMWAKRVKKHGSGGKKTLQHGIVSGNGRPPLPDSLKNKVALRQRWIETVGRTMRERPTGEVMGLPSKSIFEGIGDESDNAAEDDNDADEVESMTA